MNNKLKNGFVIPGVIVIGIFSTVFGWGKLNQKVETNTKDIVEIKEDTRKIPAIESKVEYIMTEQREMKDDMKIIQGDVKEILKAVK